MKRVKLLATSLCAIILVCSLGFSSFATEDSSDSQNTISTSYTGSSVSQSITNNKKQNDKLLKSIGYNGISITSNAEMFVSSSSYDTTDWTLLNTFPSSGGDSYTSEYSITKLYQSTWTNTNGDRLYVLEDSANVYGKTSSTGISYFNWYVYVSYSAGSIPYIYEWSPKGTTVVSQSSNINWCVQPVVLSNQLGSISGTFASTPATITGTANYSSYDLTWNSGTYGNVCWGQNPVYLGCAVVYYNTADIYTTWTWSHSWNYYY